MKNIFGNRLKKLRLEKDLTGEELGKKFNVTKVAISNWESGKRFPDPDTILKIADYFGVSLDYLYGKSNALHSISKDEIEKDEEIEELAKVLTQLNDKELEKIKNYIDITLSEIKSIKKE